MPLSPALPLCAQTLLDTPLGPLRLAANPQGLAGAWFDGQRHHPGPLAAPEDAQHPWLRSAAAALACYWARPAAGVPLDEVPLAPSGTAFQQAVWAELRRIPAGQTCTYGELARALGRPQASRAVGAAVGRNPLSLLVPCHRVVGHHGALTGYAGGLARKQWLLAAEARR